MPYGFNDDKSKYSLGSLMTNVSNLLTDAAELEERVDDLSESLPLMLYKVVANFGSSGKMALVSYPDGYSKSNTVVLAISEAGASTTTIAKYEWYLQTNDIRIKVKEGWTAGENTTLYFLLAKAE